ncbi:MAG TPA: hypothetical protein DCW55_03830 [Candidatus Pacebacteria bacterium]|nr:MAG: hypothetical protein A2378_03780 [Candidatus Pacebacteria bacterium RIFOXYB1_FULL_44_10]HAU99337.1 hypothetical protein [Candidatus Paceibacterota bacterium]HAX01949.1 hypothetical protein [Candidatus Paceibacterota bacterium]
MSSIIILRKNSRKVLEYFSASFPQLVVSLSFRSPQFLYLGLRSLYKIAKVVFTARFFVEIQMKRAEIVSLR